MEIYLTKTFIIHLEIQIINSLKHDLTDFSYNLFSDDLNG